MRILKKNGIFVAFLLTVFASCQKEEVTQTEDLQTTSAEESDGLIVLGEKLENAYSLENMKQAYSNLKSNGTISTTSSVEITANTLYVRFLPKDSADLNILWADTTIELFDYPMDYEIEEDGEYYHDPSIPEDQPTYQYTSVPIDYKFPDVEYEILEECYIPDADEDDTDGEILCSTGSSFANALETEALRITGNLETDSTGVSIQLLSRAYPSGTISVYNTETGENEGVKHVKVRVHNIIKWCTDYTDDEGYYKMSKKYGTGVHYAIVYENSTGFKIWGNWACFACANYGMGWHSKSGYSKTIGTSSKAWLWSTVNNAAYIYRAEICEEYGITKPVSNLRIWTLRTGGDWAGSTPMARHIAMDIDDLLDFLVIGYCSIKSAGITTALSLCLPDMFIFTNFTDTKECYQTLFHELSHASHYSKVGKSYWLKYIAGNCLNSGYGDGDGVYDGYIGVGEMWGNYFGEYVCCEYEFGDHDSFSFGLDYYNPGFLVYSKSLTGDLTDAEIFSCLSSTSISSLKSNLKAKTEYDSQIDVAYGKYTDWP